MKIVIQIDGWKQENKKEIVKSIQGFVKSLGSGLDFRWSSRKRNCKKEWVDLWKEGMLMAEGARPRGTDNARIIQVIETNSLRGRGTGNDPCRNVRQYWDFDGNMLAENDPCAKEKE